jgi:uncharacterized integral membrane protein
MKKIGHGVPFLMAGTVGVWGVAVAIFSTQNATPVSLYFLGLQSIQLPIGVVLLLCIGVGLVGTAAALSLIRAR